MLTPGTKVSVNAAKTPDGATSATRITISR
jgi:hypothetical protein